MRPLREPAPASEWVWMSVSGACLTEHVPAHVSGKVADAKNPVLGSGGRCLSRVLLLESGD